MARDRVFWAGTTAAGKPLRAVVSVMGYTVEGRNADGQWQPIDDPDGVLVAVVHALAVANGTPHRPQGHPT